MFDNFDARTWGQYCSSLNDNLPPEECGIELTADERKAYLQAAERLKKERDANPGIPINYQDTFELEWE